ncbi:MAG: hypothetical protein PUF63_03615 [Prevotella sp.]|nr:hypothetical protein [Prevotella sp.]
MPQATTMLACGFVRSEEQLLGQELVSYDESNIFANIIKKKDKAIIFSMKKQINPHNVTSYKWNVTRAKILSS